MTQQVFGQHTGRELRTRNYQRWLNCAEMRPGQATIAPPAAVPAETAKLLAETRSILQSHPQARAHISGDTDMIRQVWAALSPDEQLRVTCECSL